MTEKMRAEFEIFAVDMGWTGKLGLKENGDYEDWSVNPMWKAWQASRQTLVIEIPSFEDYPASMEREMQQTLRDIAEAAGLKAKIAA